MAPVYRSKPSTGRCSAFAAARQDDGDATANTGVQHKNSDVFEALDLAHVRPQSLATKFSCNDSQFVSNPGEPGWTPIEIDRVRNYLSHINRSDEALAAGLTLKRARGEPLWSAEFLLVDDKPVIVFWDRFFGADIVERERLEVALHEFGHYRGIQRDGTGEARYQALRRENLFGNHLDVPERVRQSQHFAPGGAAEELYAELYMQYRLGTADPWVTKYFDSENKRRRSEAERLTPAGGGKRHAVDQDPDPLGGKQSTHSETETRATSPLPTTVEGCFQFFYDAAAIFRAVVRP